MRLALRSPSHKLRITRYVHLADRRINLGYPQKEDLHWRRVSNGCSGRKECLDSTIQFRRLNSWLR